MLRIAALLSLLLFGCSASPPYLKPNVKIENAHTGGSLVAFALDRAVMASGGWDGSLRLWQLADGREINGWPAHAGQVNGIVFVDGDKGLLTGGYDGWLREWSASGLLLRERQTDEPISHLVADEARDIVVTGHRDGSVRLWRLSDFSLVKEYRHHGDEVRAVAMALNGALFASSDHDKQVWFWREGSEPERLEGPGSDVRTLAFSADGRYLYGGAWFDLYRWDLSSGRMDRLPTEHGGIIKQIQFGPGDEYLASISRQTDSAVLFLDPRTGATVKRFQSHDLCGAAIAVSREGRFVATTSDDASVRIWDLNNPQYGSR